MSRTLPLRLWQIESGENVNENQPYENYDNNGGMVADEHTDSEPDEEGLKSHSALESSDNTSNMAVSDNGYGGDEGGASQPSSPSVIEPQRLHPQSSLGNHHHVFPLSPRRALDTPALSASKSSNKHADVPSLDPNSPEPASSTLFYITRFSSKHVLHSLHKRTPRHNVTIRANTTSPPYLVDVPKAMLDYYCGEFNTRRLIDEFILPHHAPQSPMVPSTPDNQAPPGAITTNLLIPSQNARPYAIQRIVRYMRRSSSPRIKGKEPLYDIHVPASIGTTIDTVRALDLFGLEADAERLQNRLVYQTIAQSVNALTVNDMDTIWLEYGKTLHKTAVGDALICWILYEGIGAKNELKDKAHREVLKTLGKEGFEELKEMIHEELVRRKWKGEGKVEFLWRRAEERMTERDSRAVCLNI